MNALVLFALTAIVSAAAATHEVTEDCWDTGCQLNSWAVKGCEQYGRYSKKQRPCPGGIIYTCCKRGSEVEVEETTVLGLPKCNGELKCLAKISFPVKGCKALSKKAVKKLKEKPCIKGWVYSCCKHAEVDEPTNREISDHSAEEVSDYSKEKVKEIIEQ